MIDWGRAEILALIFVRISECHPRPAVFELQEALEWPIGLVDHLRAAGIFRRARDATSAICPGCEEQCIRPVIKRRNAASKKVFALVTCDLRGDTSTVPIPIEQLRTWRSDSFAIANLIADRAGCALREPAIRNDRIVLGSIKGNHGFRRLAVHVSDALRVSVGQLFLPIGEVIIARDSGISVNTTELKTLADRQRAGDIEPKSAKPSDGRRSDRKPETQRKYERWRKKYRRLKNENPAWSDDSICQLIANEEPEPKPRASYVRRQLYL